MDEVVYPKNLRGIREKWLAYSRGPKKKRGRHWTQQFVRQLHTRGGIDLRNLMDKNTTFQQYCAVFDDCNAYYDHEEAFNFFLPI